MYSSKLSVSIHLLSLVALHPDGPSTSDWIAGSIHTNPALVRRLLVKLKRAGLIKTQTGMGVTGLAKPADKISLLEVFRAVESEQRLFDIHTDTNLNCPVGAKIEQVLTATYDKMQTNLEHELDAVHLSQLVTLF